MTYPKKKSNVILKPIGTFEVRSGALVVSDPCYNPGENLLKGVLNGTWNAWTEHKPDDWHSTGLSVMRYRVSALIAIHSNYKAKGRKGVFVAGVDSGQCGIFDQSFYPTGNQDFEYRDSTFYGKCCESTHTTEKYPPSWPLSGDALIAYRAMSSNNVMADKEIVETINTMYGTEIHENKGSVIDNQGIVSSSGYGDGGYPVYANFNSKGQVISIRIQYI